MGRHGLNVANDGAKTHVCKDIVFDIHTRSNLQKFKPFIAKPEHSTLCHIVYVFGSTKPGIGCKSNLLDRFNELPDPTLLNNAQQAFVKLNH